MSSRDPGCLQPQHRATALAMQVLLYSSIQLGCVVQIEIAGKTVKVFVFPETATAAGDGTGAASGQPPASFPRYSFQVCCQAAL